MNLSMLTAKKAKNRINRLALIDLFGYDPSLIDLKSLSIYSLTLLI